MPRGCADLELSGVQMTLDSDGALARENGVKYRPFLRSKNKRRLVLRTREKSK